MKKERPAIDATMIMARAVILDNGRLFGVRPPGKDTIWLPGGQVLPGEPLIHGLHRLLEAQLGVRPQAAEPIGSIESRLADPSDAGPSGTDPGAGRLEIHQVFEVGLPGPPPRGHPAGQATEIVWIPLEHVANEPISPAGLGPALMHWLDTGRPFQSVIQVPGHSGGEPEGPFALRPYNRYPRQVTLRHSARAILLDGDDLILFRRTVPDLEVYWTTPGGRIEPDDADLEAALRRELSEELGATVGPARQVYTVWQQGGGIARIQHFFICRLHAMDLSKRDGPEFGEAENGLHEVERVPFTPAGVRSVRLYPEELVDYLLANLDALRRLP